MRVLSEMFPLGLFTVGILALAFCIFPVLQPRLMDKSEQLCWLFLMIPFAGFILAKIATNAFYHRYLITLLPGVAIGFACLSTRYLQKTGLCFLLLAVSGAGVLRQLSMVRNPQLIEPFAPADHQQAHTREAMQVETQVQRDGKTVIITDTLLLDQMQYYSQRSQLYAMYQPDDTPLECEYFKPVCLSPAEAARRASEMAAYYPTGRLLSDMRNAGFEATIQSMEPTLVYFTRRK
jgi:hypothetical protein